MDAAGIHRKRAVFACIGSEFVERESDRLGGANKQTSSIRLGSQGRGNEAPKALVAVIGVDHQFKWLRLRLCRNDLADLFKRLAGAFPMGAIRPVLDSAQFLFRIAGLFE